MWEPFKVENRKNVLIKKLFYVWEGGKIISMHKMV